MQSKPAPLFTCLVLTSLLAGHASHAQEATPPAAAQPEKTAPNLTVTCPLADAAQEGDEDRVRQLLAKGEEVDGAQGDGMTALHWAAKRGDANIVRVLLDHGAKSKVKTRLGGYTPVLLASASGRAEVLTLLLESGASARDGTTTGTTPLHLAAASGSVDSVRALLRRGADVNVKETVADQTPLMFAAHHGQADIIRVLTKFGADVKPATKVVKAASRSRMRSSATDSRGRGNRTNQGNRANQGNRGNRGNRGAPTPDPAAELRGQQTPPEGSRRSPRERPTPEKPAGTKSEGARQPRPGDSSPRRRGGTRGRGTQGGGTQGGGATRGGRRGRGSSRGGFRSRRSRAPSTPKKGGLTALLHACRQGKIEAAEALLDAGADIDKVSGCDQTSPLMIATINGHFDLAMVLLDRGANPNLVNAAGAGPLYAAINVEWAPYAFYPQPSTRQEKVNHLQLMEALLKAGADPNARLKTKLWYTGYNFDQARENPAGSTAFWRAAQSSDVDALRLLAANGANPRIWSKASGSRRRSGGLSGGGGLTSETPRPGATGKPDATKRPELPPVKAGDPACSPLHMATGAGFKGNFHKNAPMGWLPAVKYLVEDLGFDVNEPDHRGYTPLHHAAFRGDNEMILYLVSKGGDPLAIARSGETTVDRANGPVQRLQPFPKTIKLLESMGAKNNHRAVSK